MVDLNTEVTSKIESSHLVVTDETDISIRQLTINRQFNVSITATNSVGSATSTTLISEYSCCYLLIINIPKAIILQ